jgi:protein involved in polysaccharide export with SLBB domain
LGAIKNEVAMKRLLIFVLPFLMLVGSHLYANEADEILYPGNLISINLYGNKVISKEYRIDSKGDITFPEVGAVKCSNVTLADCKSRAIKKLSTIYKNASSLTMTRKSDDMYISILGLVKTPGLYLISPNTSFQLALQKAGGLSDGAQMNKIQLRHGDKITEVNFRKFLDNGDEKALPPLNAMDEIFVPSSSLISNVSSSTTTQGKGESKSSWLETPSDKSVKIFGGIMKPGRYPWSDDMNLLDLIAEAGGPSRDADTNNIRIVTPQTANQKSEVVKFNLSRFIESGGNVNLVPTIKAGSTISIPEVRESMSNDKLSWIKQDPKTVIYVFGEVRKPGRYSFDDKVKFS